MSAGKTKALLLMAALVLSVLLFIAPRTKPPEKGEKSGPSEGSAGNIAAVTIYRDMAVKSLEPARKEAYDRFDIEKRYDSLQEFWTKTKRPDLAALASENKALVSGKADDYFLAGNRYYNAVRFTSDNSERPVLYQAAIRCFSQGLKKDPRNTDARIMLASCYVEGSSEPMQGIRLLQEVERTDSNNVKLQLTFAFFAAKSGQLDKAISRFKKVLAIDSTYIEAYLHLADAYEQQGDMQATIRMLERYAALTDDVTARIEVNKYIDQLKTRKNN
jgi:tetratricopeptide (TPR) repeat protein